MRYEANVVSTGRVRGYRFAMTTDQAGEPVWFKASQLDRSLSWNRVRERIEMIEPVRVESVVAEPKKFFESKASHAQRVEAAQQATEQAQAKAVAAKREQRLEKAAPPQNLGKQIRARAAAQQRAQAYRERVAERREWLSHVGRIREVREPEGGWKSMRQIDKATKKRMAAQKRTGASAPTLSDYQARQRRQHEELRQVRRGLSR